MNNKQLIGEHKIRYENWKSRLDKHEERTLNELEIIKQDRTRLDFYRFQIEEAEKLGKRDFDRSRFRVKR